MKAEIINHLGVSRVCVNGEIIPLPAFRTFRANGDTARAMYASGVKLFSAYPSGIICSLGTPYSRFGEFWLGEGVYDYDALRREIDEFTNNAPGAYLSLTLQMDARDWFAKSHQGTVSSFDHLMEMAACRDWLASAKRMTRDVLGFINAAYPEKLYAVYVCAGGTCEWYNREYLHETPAKLRAWREHTGDDAREIPSEAALEHASLGVFRDAETDKEAIDYWRFTQEAVANALIELAENVKDYDSGLLTGAFFGNILTFTGDLLRRCQACVTKVYDSGVIDMVFSPASYLYRGLESVSSTHLPIASARLRGMMYFHEIDNTTYAANHNPYAQALQMYAHRKHNSLRETVMYLRREAAYTWGQLGAYWWFDMFGGWYDDDELMREIAKINAAGERLYSKPVVACAQVALLADEETNYYLPSNIVLHERAVRLQREPLGRVGCAIDYYVAGDLTRADFPLERYKLLILPDLYAPTDAMRRAIDRARKAGVSMLFLYAPGALVNGKFDERGMSALTGIELRASNDDMGYTRVLPCAYSELDHPRVCGDRFGYMGLRPGVYAQERDECVFGRDLLTGRAQYAVKPRAAGGFDAWLATGPAPDWILRALAREAGVFRYIESDLPVYANSRMINLFSREGGKLTLNTPWGAGYIEEMYTGERHDIIPGADIALEFERDENKCFIYEEAKPC